jgi:hypothetical protein
MLSRALMTLLSGKKRIGLRAPRMTAAALRSAIQRRSIVLYVLACKWPGLVVMVFVLLGVASLDAAPWKLAASWVAALLALSRYIDSLDQPIAAWRRRRGPRRRRTDL